ncbi:MAG: Gfo/Idh/MocA family oxidoreductase [Clostridia bacterium]|nr:Gfo/Idh/MocA family oxidoreductase [Clostridia bacterium]
MNVAIIGVGARGSIYAKQFHSNGYKIVALCEKNPAILHSTAKKYGVSPDKCFANDEEFFAQGKLADILVVATQDRDHYGHAKQGLNLGYHLLCEKPVSPILEQCEELNALAIEKDRYMVVCHVLRYAPYYDATKKVIDSGKIGKVTNINHVENVGYWHFSHSYVRGNWRREDETAPSILAKCCHDLDMIYYWTGKKCKRVYSIGERREFLNENAPEGAPTHCEMGCPHAKNCPYEASKIYYRPTLKTIPYMIVKKRLVCGKDGATMKEFKEALKTSPYGRCVYRCDNDVIENQVVSMVLEDGINATHTMTAQSQNCYRHTRICGTKGEIIGDDNSFCFKLHVFGERPKKIRVRMLGIGHLGGDAGVVKDFITLMETGVVTPRMSLMSTTLESHKIAFAAEESRKTGKVIELND